MSLPGFKVVAGRGRFPRVSGDEPLMFLPSLAFASFSPRERG